MANAGLLACLLACSGRLRHSPGANGWRMLSLALTGTSNTSGQWPGAVAQGGRPTQERPFCWRAARPSVTEPASLVCMLAC